MHASRATVPTLGLAVAALLSAAVAVGVGVAPPATAAARTADVSFTAPTASWSQSAPMDGTAAVNRNTTCTAPTHPCDDFTLNVARGADGQAQLLVEVTPSAGDELEIAVYPPGCSTAPGDTSGCVTVYTDTKAKIVGAANGAYVIRMTCDACTSATYDAKATLSHVDYALAPAGDQSPGWSVRQLPVKATGFTSFGEPGISINKLGHVIVNTFGPTVWISTDDGHTWGPPLDSVDPTPCRDLSGDADAVVSDDDTYYADNLCLAGPTNLSYASHDTGKTWNASQGGLPNLPGAATDSDRQWYALDPSDPAVVYISYHDFLGPNIWVNKSTDHGQTWTQQSPITLTSSNALDALGNYTSRPLVDPTDPKRVLVFYASGRFVTGAQVDPTGPLQLIWMAESKDGGATWGQNVLVHDAGATDGKLNNVANIVPVGAIDGAGNAYVVFAQSNGGQTETHVKLVAVPKGSAPNPTAKAIPVDHGGLRSNVMPWVVAGDAGRVAMSW
jgi:hypothetical protein